MFNIIRNRNVYYSISNNYKIYSCYYKDNISFINNNNNKKNNLFIQKYFSSSYFNSHFNYTNNNYFNSKEYNRNSITKITRLFSTLNNNDKDIDNIIGLQKEANNHMNNKNYTNAINSYSSCLDSIDKLLKTNISENTQQMAKISTIQLTCILSIGLSYFGNNELDKAKETYLLAFRIIENIPNFNIIFYVCYFHQYCEILYKMNNNTLNIVIDSIKQLISNFMEKELHYFNNRKPLQDELYILFSNIYAHNYRCGFDILHMYNDSFHFQNEMLKFYRSIVGDTKDIAFCFNKIGNLLEHSQKYKEALDYKLTSLEINKSIDDNNTNIAMNYNEIGKLHANLREYKKAIDVFEKSLELYKSSKGNNHPNVAITYHNIGLSFSDLGRYEESLEKFHMALKILKSNSEDQSHLIANTLLDIGKVLNKVHRYEEALKYCNESHSIFNDIYGNKNTYNASILCTIASIKYNMGKHEQSLEDYKTVLEIITQSKNTRIDPIQVIDSIGNNFCKLEQYNEALKYYLESLDMRYRIYNKDSIDIANSNDKIAWVYEVLGQYDLALKYQQQSLDIIQSKYTIDHKDTIMNIMNISNILYNLKRYQEALDYYNKILPIINENYAYYGKIHYRLGEVYKALKEYKKASEHHTIALNHKNK